MMGATEMCAVLCIYKILTTIEYKQLIKFVIKYRFYNLIEEILKSSIVQDSGSKRNILLCQVSFILFRFEQTKRSQYES